VTTIDASWVASLRASSRPGHARPGRARPGHARVAGRPPRGNTSLLKP